MSELYEMNAYYFGSVIKDGQLLLVYSCEEDAEFIEVYYDFNDLESFTCACEEYQIEIEEGSFENKEVKQKIFLDLVAQLNETSISMPEVVGATFIVNENARIIEVSGH
jgi:hypothetical protein